jgi:hypothetical protein
MFSAIDVLNVRTTEGASANDIASAIAAPNTFATEMESAIPNGSDIELLEKAYP